MPPLTALLGGCLTLLLCGAVSCALAVPAARVPDYDSLQDIYRDTRTGARKPVRADAGLGSLLLKNLRFRDLASRSTQQLDSSFPLWPLRHQNAEDNEFLPTDLDDSPNSIGRGASIAKRQSNVDVSQLAQLLSDLKTRNADGDGVKLQSLRFGRRRR